MKPLRAAGFGLVYLASLASGLLTARGDSVRWHYIGNGSPPVALTLFPPAPTSTNVLTFIAATDGIVYGNSCMATVEKGEPYLSVDSNARVVYVRFFPPPPPSESICFQVVLPVSGVDGQLGPLPAGTWTLNILSRWYSFTVAEPPLRLALHPSTNSAVFQVDWPICAEPYVLEFADGPAFAWQTATNPVARVGELNRVEIKCDSGTRLYRLRRL